jgi:hypothetical protein
MLSDRHIAGILFVMLMCVPIGIWGIYLFIGNPPNLSMTVLFESVFSPGLEGRAFFLWLTVSTMISVIIVATWFLSRIASRSVVFVVTALSVGEAVGYSFWSGWDIALLSLLPIYWVYRAYRRENRSEATVK